MALVVGVPMDFRLGFGGAFGQETEIVAVDVGGPQRGRTRGRPRWSCRVAERDPGRPARGGGGRGARRSRQWVAELRAAEAQLREAERAELEDERTPLHPMRVYGELRGMLERDAVVVGDGGNFVSYAGRVVDSFEPGCWLDPGPFGCLGAGPGYALAAKLAHPSARWCCCGGTGPWGLRGWSSTRWRATA